MNMQNLVCPNPNLDMKYKITTSANHTHTHIKENKTPIKWKGVRSDYMYVSYFS